MSKKILATLAALLLVGCGIVLPVSANTPATITYESVVTTCTSDSPTLEINTTIIEETPLNKHPQRRLYSPRRGASGGGKW